MDQFIIDVIEWTCQDSSWRLVSSQGFPSVDDLMDTRSATALQSMEIASDTILSGKAKVMVAGGFDDLCEEGSYEFGNMKATSNSETELAMGREPTEMSRPTTTTRAGVRSLIILT
jgi:3-oxoacyl-(acyl-carrier-protein) synthase